MEQIGSHWTDFHEILYLYSSVFRKCVEEIQVWFKSDKNNGYLTWIILIIGIQPLGRSGQRPEFSQATGMALVRCILGKVLGVACHCFPPLFRCSNFSPPSASTSATTWEIPAAEVGTMSGSFAYMNLGNFYVPQMYDMGPTALLPLRGKACWGIFRP
jgi:hypothetical protein